MDLRVIENLETELSIEIQDEDHTFMNVLKDALLEVDGVAAATYDMNPEIGRASCRERVCPYV